MAGDIDKKIEALNDLFRRDDMFKRVGDTIVATVGGINLGVLDVETKLQDLGLKEGQGYKVTDPKSGTIEISTDALPVPSGGMHPYKKYIDSGIGKFSGLAKASHADLSLVDIAGRAIINADFKTLEDQKSYVRNLERIGLVKDEQFFGGYAKTPDGKVVEAMVGVYPDKVKLPEPADQILEKLTALEGATGLKFSFDSRTGEYKTRPLTDNQINGLAGLDSHGKTRPVFQAITSDVKMSGDDLIELANKPENKGKVDITFTPQQLTPEVLKILTDNKGIISDALKDKPHPLSLLVDPKDHPVLAFQHMPSEKVALETGPKTGAPAVIARNVGDNTPS